MKRVKIAEILAVFCLFAVSLRAQVAVNLYPVSHPQFLDTNGKPLASGKVFTYQAGTSTPLATYTDSTGTVQNPNPIILDAGGFANIWLQQQAYKVCVQNSSGVQQWCVDNVSATNLNLANVWSQQQTFSSGILTALPLSLTNNGFTNSLTASVTAARSWTLPDMSDTIALLSFAQAFNSKTFDISANTLKNSTNTAGHYPRNNGTQYVDNTIQPADYPVFGASGASHAQGAVPDPGSTTGTSRFLREDGTWSTATTDIQIFTSTGANTWTKPANAKATVVILIGGGGGGGSGTGALNSGTGGAGGGGAGVSYQIFSSAILGATETVTVGAGGIGGIGNNVAGATGSSTTFGQWLLATGGGGGQGSSSGSAGVGGYGNFGQGGAGGAGGAAAAPGAGGSAAGLTSLGAGGGAGGGGTDGTTAAAGGNGGSGSQLRATLLTGGTGGTSNTAGGSGTSPSVNEAIGGPGGGGGGASNGSTPGAGGAPTRYGGGGGGGGGRAAATGAGGGGGAGAPGIAIIVSY